MSSTIEILNKNAFERYKAFIINYYDLQSSVESRKSAVKKFIVFLNKNGWSVSEVNHSCVEEFLQYELDNIRADKTKGVSFF